MCRLNKEEPAERACLKCRKAFESHSKGNRLCGGCQVPEEWWCDKTMNLETSEWKY